MADKTDDKAAFADSRSITLKKSGIRVDYDADPATADVIAASKAAGKDTALFPIYLAQRVATFDGQRWTAGEIRDRLRGKDYLQLAGALLGEDEVADAGN